MSEKKRKVICYRCEDENSQNLFSIHEIPYHPEMTIMKMLDYVTEFSDPTFSHLTHSRCNQGYCGRCAVRVNGRVCLACDETTSDEIVIIEPVDKKKLSKDLAPRP